MPDLWCEKCQAFMNDKWQVATINGFYCKICVNEGQPNKLTKKPKQAFKSNSVESVGLDWKIDSIRGKALEIMKKNNTALNSDEQLFLLYLEEYRDQLIIRKPTDNEISGLLADLLMGEYHEGYRKESIKRVLEFIEKLKVNPQNLTSFQTLRLARQELKREAKRKGMLQLFDPIVEEMRTDREKTIKARYRRESVFYRGYEES